MPDLVEALRSFLPEAFPEKDAGQLSGGVLVPGTMANDRAKRKVPRHCYTHDAAGRVIIFRDPFLDEYYRPKLEKRQPIKAPSVRRNRSRAASAVAEPAPLLAEHSRHDRENPTLAAVP